MSGYAMFCIESVKEDIMDLLCDTFYGRVCFHLWNNGDMPKAYGYM